MRVLILMAVCLSLAACASGAQPAQMIAAEGTTIGASSSLRDSMTVGAITGGSKTSPLWKSEVSNEDFAEALRQTLIARTMLASSKARFVLNAELVELDQPTLGGFDMDVTSTVKYRLTSADGSKTLFETTVKKLYTANFSSTFLGVKRLQLANEGSMRENIKQFIEELIAASEKDPAFKLDAKAISQLRGLVPGV
ncbi:MAG: hypothetical protein ABL996_18825 [Micropepsaceae bacterium]